MAGNDHGDGRPRSVQVQNSIHSLPPEVFRETFSYFQLMGRCNFDTRSLSATSGTTTYSTIKIYVQQLKWTENSSLDSLATLVVFERRCSLVYALSEALHLLSI
jgi:hypothetical protein